MTKTVLYQDTINPLNSGYRDLFYHFSMHDYKAGYLKSYAHLLSPNLPDETIWQTQEWKEISAMCPLPEDGDLEVTEAVFESYMIVFENIARRVGLMDKDPVEPESKDDVDMVILGGVRWEASDTCPRRTCSPTW